MNKLLLDKEENVLIENNVLLLECRTSKVYLTIKGNVLINDIVNQDRENVEYHIKVLRNSSCLYNCYKNHSVMKNAIYLEQEENSSLIFNYSFVASGECVLNVDSVCRESNTNTEINVAAVTENLGCVSIKSTGDIKPNVKEINLSENLKVMNLNDSNNIIVPNLLVSSDEVNVSHSATIGGVDQNSLFYLSSKGISNEQAILLLKMGFLLSNVSVEKDLFEEIKSLIIKEV